MYTLRLVISFVVIFSLTSSVEPAFAQEMGDRITQEMVKSTGISVPDPNVVYSMDAAWAARVFFHSGFGLDNLHHTLLFKRNQRRQAYVYTERWEHYRGRACELHTVVDARIWQREGRDTASQQSDADNNQPAIFGSAADADGVVIQVAHVAYRMGPDMVEPTPTVVVEKQKLVGFAYLKGPKLIFEETERGGYSASKVEAPLTGCYYVADHPVERSIGGCKKINTGSFFRQFTRLCGTRNPEFVQATGYPNDPTFMTVAEHAVGNWENILTRNESIGGLWEIWDFQETNQERDSIKFGCSEDESFVHCFPLDNDLLSHLPLDFPTAGKPAEPGNPREITKAIRAHIRAKLTKAEEDKKDDDSDE